MEFTQDSEQLLISSLNPGVYNLGVGAFTSLTKADVGARKLRRKLDGLKWHGLRYALAAPVAVGGKDGGAYVIDVATGTATLVTKDSHVVQAISPTGDRIAVSTGLTNHVYDVSTRARLWEPTIAAPYSRLTFGDNEDVVAYVNDADRRIRVVDMSTGERAFEAPARFARWGGPGAAVVARGPAEEVLTLESLVRGPADANVAMAAPRGAPAWATATDGAIAWEPVELPPIWMTSPMDQDWRECPATLRVYTTKGKTKKLTLKSNDTVGDTSRADPCWQVQSGRVLGVTRAQIAIFDPRTGKRLTRLDAGGEESKDDVRVNDYFAAQLSPDATRLALWWRRPHISQEPDDPHVAHSEGEPSCHKDSDMYCEYEWFAEMWDVSAKSRLLWQSRLDADRDIDPSYSTRTRTAQPKNGSGPIAFTHDGSYVLFGFADGDVLMRNVATGDIVARQSLHDAPIIRIDVSPDDKYVFSEDAQGEQRIWPHRAAAAP